MAEDVTFQTATPATPPDLTVVAADDIAGIKYQKVKLVDGTADSTAVIPGSATDGLLVNLGANNDVTVSGTATVSGTVAATQSGTWTVQPGNTANTTAWKVDGSAVTQPVSGTVTVNALPAGSNNIGDVDVLSVPAPLSTTGAGTEAAALRVTLATDSTGLVSVDDNGGSLTVDGTVAVSSVGGTVAATQSGTWNVGTVSTVTNVVHVDDNASSLTVDNAGTFAVQAAATQSGTWTVQPGNTANTTAWKVDASSVAVPITDNSGSLTVDYATTGHGTATGALRVELPTDGTGTLATVGTITNVVHVDDNSGSLTVDGTVAVSSVGGTVTVGSHAVTNAGTFAVQAAEADGANVTLGAKADAKSTATDTTAISAMSVLKQISASVQAPPSQAVTNAGTFAVQAVDAGVAAHDAAISGNPVRVGARARTSDVTAVSSDDTTDLITDLIGRLINVPYCIPENTLTGSTSKTDTTDSTVIAAQGGSLRIYVTSISVANSGSADTVVEVKDGAAGTVLWRTIAPTKGGSNMTFAVPLRLTANTLLAMAALTSSTTVYFSAQGYKGV